MAGLVPAIHVFLPTRMQRSWIDRAILVEEGKQQGVDGRDKPDKPGHDEEGSEIEAEEAKWL